MINKREMVLDKIFYDHDYIPNDNFKTRCDFYVARDGKSIWLGSAIYDGWSSCDRTKDIVLAQSEDDFEDAVIRFLEDVEAEDEVVWPLTGGQQAPNSHLTDHDYTFTNGAVWKWSHGPKRLNRLDNHYFW